MFVPIMVINMYMDFDFRLENTPSWQIEIDRFFQTIFSDRRMANLLHGNTYDFVLSFDWSFGMLCATILNPELMRIPVLI